MNFQTAQKTINKLGATNNTLTIGNAKLTITEKRGELDDIMVEYLDQPNPFNTGSKPFKFNQFRTLAHGIKAAQSY
jgi:hypothetical protein